MTLRRIALLVLLIAVASLATAQSKPGTVSGTVVFVSESGKFVEAAPSTTIQLTVDDLRGEFSSDEMGDFNKRVPVGKYTITGVVGCGGEKLALYGKQQLTFEVSPNQFKRFDVMVKVPEQHYRCGAASK